MADKSNNKKSEPLKEGVTKGNVKEPKSSSNQGPPPPPPKPKKDNKE